MIHAKKNTPLGKLFAIYHKRLLKKHFFAVQLAGMENFELINDSMPVIMYANHSNWWDGFIAYLITNRLLKKDDYLMMDIEQMKKYSFFKYIGVFSVNRNIPAEAVRSLNYAAELLTNSNKYMWIFPQGEMLPQDKRPLKFFSGIAKIAEKTGSINLVPVCFRYEFIMEQRPEVFISIGKPEIVAGKINGDLTESLRSTFESQLDKLKDDVLIGNTSAFKTIFIGKNSRNKTFD
ncbi:MAG: lysophospholipid acyltransferase family protein [Ignavibacteria bacterium]